jgi:hypothetical protein
MIVSKLARQGNEAVGPLALANRQPRSRLWLLTPAVPAAAQPLGWRHRAGPTVGHDPVFHPGAGFLFNQGFRSDHACTRGGMPAPAWHGTPAQASIPAISSGRRSPA